MPVRELMWWRERDSHEASRRSGMENSVAETPWSHLRQKKEESKDWRVTHR